MSYFNNIKGIGSLDIDYIIFEASYPVLFTCIDKNKKLYLCLCCEVRSEQRWIISQTTKANIVGLLTNKVTLRDAFKNEEDESYIVTWKYSTQREESRKVQFDQIDPLDLPTENEFLEAEEDEYTDYIDRLMPETQVDDYSVLYEESRVESAVLKSFTLTKKIIEYDFSSDDFSIYMNRGSVLQLNMRNIENRLINLCLRKLKLSNIVSGDDEDESYCRMCLTNSKSVELYN